jgi:hypothetical protein
MEEGLEVAWAEKLSLWEDDLKTVRCTLSEDSKLDTLSWLYFKRFFPFLLL